MKGVLIIPKVKKEKTKTDKVTSKKKKETKPKTFAWKFEIGDSALYVGGIADKIYKNTKVTILDRDRANHREDYKVECFDGSVLQTVAKALEKIVEKENTNKKEEVKSI